MRGTKNGKPTEEERGLSNRMGQTLESRDTRRGLVPIQHVAPQCPGRSSSTFTSRGVNFTVHSNILEVFFNRGPGRVGIDANSFIANRPALRFYTGSPNQGAPRTAWHFEADFQTSFTIPGRPTGPAAGEWEIGFLQSVERYSASIQYDGFPNPFNLNVRNARDANPITSAPLPWYNNRGAPGGPVDFIVSQGTPKIFDMPTLSLHVWRNARQQQNGLQLVRFEGVFHIWLVAKHTADPNLLRSLNFLHHLSLSFNHTWQYQGNDSRESINSWQSNGSQQYLTCGSGQGRATPILTGTTAHDQLQQQISRWPATP